MIEEKTAVLQKRDSEGFGFVLRGAKGRMMDWLSLTMKTSEKILKAELLGVNSVSI